MYFGLGTTGPRPDGLMVAGPGWVDFIGPGQYDGLGVDRAGPNGLWNLFWAKEVLGRC